MFVNDAGQLYFMQALKKGSPPLSCNPVYAQTSSYSEPIILNIFYVRCRKILLANVYRVNLIKTRS